MLTTHKLLIQTTKKISRAWKHVHIRMEAEHTAITSQYAAFPKNNLKNSTIKKLPSQHKFSPQPLKHLILQIKSWMVGRTVNI